MNVRSTIQFLGDPPRARFAHQIHRYAIDMVDANYANNRFDGCWVRL
jgi:hypothetical protein